MFKKAILLSFLGHLTVFSIFSFSFTDKTASVGYSDIFFMGGILNNADLRPFIAAREPVLLIERQIKGLLSQNKAFMPKMRPQAPVDILSGGWFKPWVSPAFNQYRTLPLSRQVYLPAAFTRKMPVLMFYPQLPYNFALYFKDRQVAHIELDFQVVSVGHGDSLVVRRKISSGNLETDLLSIRYISRYLSLQQGAFTPNQWQAVKIDLSAVSDGNVVK